MNPIDHAKTYKNMGEMFQQVADRIPGSVAHICQITARAEYWHKRKQRQQSHEWPDDFISP